MPDALGVLVSRLRSAGSVREVAKAAGVPRTSVQGILDGHTPSVTRAAEICRALDLEFYIGPPRPHKSVKLPPVSQISEAAGGPSARGVPVADRRLAELLSAVAAHYEALNEPGRAALVTRFEHAFPELRGGGRNSAGSSRGSGGG